MILRHRYVSLRREAMKVGGKAAARQLITGKLIAHVNYLRYRPGDDREQGQREFFDDQRSSVEVQDVRKWIKEYCQKGDPVIHYLTLAPDVNPEDHVAFTREVMTELGNELGLELLWRANFHRNTAHHHGNVLLLGRDKNGRQVRLSKEDYARVRDIGDRFLDREHPFERETKRLQKERAAQEKEYMFKSAVEGRLQKEQGQLLSVPWLKRQVFTETTRANLPTISPPEPARETDRTPESIKCGRTLYTQETSLRKLNALDEKLRKGWFFGEVSADQYSQLVGWIEKNEDAQGKKHPDRIAPLSENPEEFQYGGVTFTKDSSYADFYKLETWLKNWNREAKFLGFAEQPMPHADFHKFLEWSAPKRTEFFENFNGGIVDHAQAAHELKLFKQAAPARAPSDAQAPNDPVNVVVQFLHRTVKGVLDLIPTDYGLGTDPLSDAQKDLSAKHTDLLKSLNERQKMTPEERYEASRMLQNLDSAHQKVVAAAQERVRKEDHSHFRRTRMSQTDMEDLLHTNIVISETQRLDNWEF